MTSPKDSWNYIAKFSTRTLAQLAAEHSRPKQDIMQGLIAARSMTVFRADPGVETAEFMYVLAQYLAVGRDLGPFAVPEAVKVALFVCTGARGKDGELAGLLEEKCAAEVPDHECAANLSVYLRHAEDDPICYLNTHEGQQALLNSLPLDCRAVVIDDVAAWLSPRNIAPDDAIPLSDLCDKLAAKGIAMVLFEKSRNAAEPFLAAYRQGAQHLVRLVKDDCAPSVVGGSFRVVRERMRYSESVPVKIQWWYTVIDGKFDEGWQLPDPERTISAKEMAIVERRIEVEKLDKAGFSQKQIAEKLQIKQWTVSRDLAAINEQPVENEDAAAEIPEETSKPIKIVGRGATALATPAENAADATWD